MILTKAQLKKLQQDFNGKMARIKKEMNKVFSDFQKKIDDNKVTLLKKKINSL